MEKTKWDRFKIEHRRNPKRKPDDDENLPAGWKKPNKLRRMEKC